MYLIMIVVLKKHINPKEKNIQFWKKHCDLEKNNLSKYKQMPFYSKTLI